MLNYHATEKKLITTATADDMITTSVVRNVQYKDHKLNENTIILQCKYSLPIELTSLQFAIIAPNCTEFLTECI